VPAVRQIANISYGPTLAYGANLLDLYIPTATGPHPVIVCIHGGGWLSGDKRQFPFSRILKNGYAVATINYRLSEQATFPAQIIDCKMAVSWLRAHAREYTLDPDRIGVWGISAGGHLAALVGLTADAKSPVWAGPYLGTSNRVQAVCDWCGPTDLVSISHQKGMDYRIASMVSQLLGTPPAVNPSLASEASPVLYANKAVSAPPFLIMHGEGDAIVPLDQSEELNRLLALCKGEHTLSVIAGGKHNFDSRTAEQQVIKFFDRVLKGSNRNP
jgi:acetyl esterase/lipase